MRILLVVVLALGSCLSRNRLPESRAEIRPADYGLTDEEWALCGAHFGPAGNPPTFEAEWCAKNKAYIAQQARERAERPAREQREAEERARQTAQLKEWQQSPQIRFIALSAKLCKYAEWRA